MGVDGGKLHMTGQLVGCLIDCLIGWWPRCQPHAAKFSLARSSDFK